MQTHPDTDNQTSLRTAVAWPTDVSARFLTRGAILTSNPNATVDITDTDSRSNALCQPCGWKTDHGIAYRSEVLERAQDHADNCSALAHPHA